MTNFTYICIMWISVSVVLLSAVPEISVSGPVGSTAVLPCELMSVDTDTLYIRWFIKSETVFERKSKESYHAEGYEGRVDVPVEELRKGNCSLVLHNLRLNDTGVYTSYQTVRHTKRSASASSKAVLVSRVKLSVIGTDRRISPPHTDDAGIKSPHTLIMVLSFISRSLVQLFCGV